MNDIASRTVARFIVSLATALLLIAPLIWILESSSYTGMVFALVGSVCIAALFGQLLNGALTGSINAALVTSAWFNLIALLSVMVFGADESPTTTALAVGVPSAAAAAALSAGMASLTENPAIWHPDRNEVRPGIKVALIGLALSAGALAPFIGDRLEDGRNRAAIIAGFEGQGVLPLKVEIEGFSANQKDPVRLGSTEYTIELVDENSKVDSSKPTIYITVTAIPTDDRSSLEDSLYCDVPDTKCDTSNDGFVIAENAEGDIQIAADSRGTRLEASLPDGDNAPDPDNVGDALVHAELVDWDELVDFTRAD